MTNYSINLDESRNQKSMNEISASTNIRKHYGIPNSYAGCSRSKILKYEPLADTQPTKPHQIKTNASECDSNEPEFISQTRRKAHAPAKKGGGRNPYQIGK